MADTPFGDAGKIAAIDKQKMTEGQEKPNGTAALYWREIERYNRAVSDWYQEGDEIENVYLDQTRTSSSQKRKFPLLWANVEVLKPAVYAKIPTVLCSRRYKDRDVIGRIAAELMERATNTTFDLYNVDSTFKLVRDDRLIPGRGQGWVRYESHIEAYDDPDGTIDNETGEIVQRERLAGEKVCVDYVHWKDFGHNIARTWSEVWLVWRIVYKTLEEAAERFGQEKASRLSYTHKGPTFGGSGASSDTAENCAKIYELWDKRRRQTVWMAEGAKGFLEEGDPPLDLQNFFPCPEPCYATKTSKGLIPRPDYAYYRDQAKEINDLTDKIGTMSQWLIVKGVVPGGPSTVADPLEAMLDDKSNREMFYKVDSQTEWTERGGLNKLIDWFPVEKIVQALQGAISVRAELIKNVFEITGIGDILRGQTNPNETLGAQELKAQTGTRRLRNTKDDIARFTRDIARIVAEVIAERFQPESIAEITGYQYVPAPPPMPLMGTNVMPMRPNLPAMLGHNQPPAEESLTFNDDVIQLLRDDKMRSFRIDIETDSTVQADEQAEKQSRIEFMNVFGQFLERAASTAKMMPDMGNALVEAALFVSRGFRAGRSLEDALESGMKASVKRLQQAAANPPPDPRVQVEQAKLQQKAANDQAERALDAQQQQTDAQLQVRQQNIDAALQTRKQNLDAQERIRHNTLTANAQARDRAAKLLQ